MHIYKNKTHTEAMSSSTNISIVVSEFNVYVTNLLKEGAIETLLDHGINKEHISVYSVAGAFEIPVTCKRILQKNSHIDGIIALGAIIQGETPHFDCVVQATTSGIMQVQLEFAKPIAFGVITTDNSHQAIERAGLKHGNKGSESAKTLLGLLNIYNQASI